MQIARQFRDLQSRQVIQTRENGLTRMVPRIESLLLQSASAMFATSFFSMACEASGLTPGEPFRLKRRLCSIMRLDREALTRR